MRVNLHTHLEGSVRPETAAELARAVGVPEPRAGWQAALELSAPADLTVFLACVAEVYPVLGSPDAMERVAYEAVCDAGTDGCDYLELRFGPATHARRGFPIDDVVTAVCRGVAAATDDTGVAAGVVVAALRHLPDDVNLAVVEAAANHAGRGVVGFDLAGDELVFPDLQRYAGLFTTARAAGLGVTCHAAEAAPATSAREAVQSLGVRRVGHGVRVAENPEVMAWLAAEQVCLEVCPTSNWLTGAVGSVAQHPVRRFVDAGIPVVVGDDDPVTTGSPLSAELSALVAHLGFSDDELRRVAETSVAVAFAEESTRGRLAGQLASAGPARR
jgi:adenosine deaminase